MFGIALYYSVIISWCLNYLFLSFKKAWGADVNNFFFKEFLVTTSGPLEVGGVKFPILLGSVFIWFLNWLIVYRGIGRGIELANKIFMPLLFILVAILVLWSVTLEGAKGGIIVYLKPNFSILSRPKVWIDAYSQVFFSLGLGFGILIAYASYLPERSNITGNAILVSIADSSFSVFAGFAVFSILGYMAYKTGRPIESVVYQGIGLAFVTYPQAINLLPAFGNIFGVIFFLALVVAGLTSLISIVEAFVAATVDKFDLSRGRVISVVSILGFIGGIIFTTGGGLFWLDIVDHFLSHYGLVVVGILECILVGWLFRIEIIRNHINKVSNLKVGFWWDFTIKFLIPIALTIILTWDLVNELKKPYGGYGWDAIWIIGVDWLLITLIIALILAWFPWKENALRV
jgi:NSS family neurotransmitter:Na+ symporter